MLDDHQGWDGSQGGWRAKLRGKRPKHVIRALLVHVWPLSIVGRWLYRLRWLAPVYQAINRRSRRLYAAHRQRLDLPAFHAVRSLRKDGLYQTSIAGLLGRAELFDDLRADAGRLLAVPEVQARIQRRSHSLDRKWYVVRAIGHRARRQPIPASFGEFFLHERMLAIASAYFGVQPRLNYVDVWHNFAVRDGEPAISAEYWHRDHEDKHVLKVFLYLEAIDETMGPLTYLRGSQPGGAFGTLFPAVPPTGCYPEPAALAAQVKARSIPVLSCIGEAGTVVRADTGGLHRGGRSHTKPRVVLIGVYTTNAGLDSTRYSLIDAPRRAALSPMARFALYR
ncbi:MAG: hypothetical protein U0231_01615 [Nitrospiraceae bacterium]